MSAISSSLFTSTQSLSAFSSSRLKLFPISQLSHFPKSHSFTYNLYISRKTLIAVSSKSSEAEEDEEDVSSSNEEDEWLNKLPDKKKPLYSHSLPCIEAWLKDLGFYQSKDDRAVWFIEKLEWHAQLSLDITDLFIRYLKSGPGNLDKDVERRFSYALSREDIEYAILGGP